MHMLLWAIVCLWFFLCYLSCFTNCMYFSNILLWLDCILQSAVPHPFRLVRAMDLRVCVCMYYVFMHACLCVYIYTGWSKSLSAPDDYSTKNMRNILNSIRWPSQNTLECVPLPYLTRSLRTQFDMSINVWRLAGDTLNNTCNFLYCNHQVHTDFLINLYIYIVEKEPLLKDTLHMSRWFKRAYFEEMSLLWRSVPLG
jgi:hypothetical protein